MNWQYKEGLVSVLTPCYNTGAIVHRLLDSILCQDYPLVEVIVVNDGSTDNTEQVLLSYKSKYEDRGYSFRYIYQENGGQSAAINNGLKYVTGEFLTWPDSDDCFKRPDTISSFVKAFLEYPTYGVIRCLPTYVEDITLSNIRNLKITKPFRADNQFENCLFSHNFYWGAGDYFVRMQCFDSVNSNRQIYNEKGAGQNWQMLLPILYSYKCRTIEEHLFSVLIRSESHSRIGEDNYNHLLERAQCYKKTILHTLDKIEAISDEQRSKYKYLIENYYLKENYWIALQFGQPLDARSFKRELMTNGERISIIKEIAFRFRQSGLFSYLRRFKRHIQNHKRVLTND